MTGEGSARPNAAVDGVPCRPYQVGQHASALSRMLLWRLLASGVIAGVLAPTISLLVALLMLRGRPPDDLGPLRQIGSPLLLGLILLVVDYLLIRGRLSRTLSVLVWAGRRGLSDLRATTGVANPASRSGAAEWLAAHPKPPEEDPAVTASRAHLQVVVGDLDGARASVESLPDLSHSEALLKAVLGAQVDLAAGRPFDAADLRARVEAIPDQGLRAYMSAEVAALIAQARWTCGGDHLGTVDWAGPYVARRDRGTLLRSYWLPVTGLTLLVSLLLGVVFPSAA